MWHLTMADSKDQKAPAEIALEEDDVFEEFAVGGMEPEVAADETRMWEAEWDDEDTKEDFQVKLQQELDRSMKE